MGTDRGGRGGHMGTEEEGRKREHLGFHGCLKQLFINFLTKMSYFTSQDVENPVQIIEYDELSRFQPILKL